LSVAQQQIQIDGFGWTAIFVDVDGGVDSGEGLSKLHPK